MPRILDGLFRPQHDYLPGTEMFRNVDVPLLAARLRVDERGTEDGGTNFPPADSAAKSPLEDDIRRTVLGHWDETLTLARRAMEAYRSRWSSHSVDVEIDTVHGRPDLVSGNLKRIVTGIKSDLHHAREQYTLSRNELETFRLQERLTRPAAPDKPLGFLVGVLSVAFFVELVVNLSIFAGGDEFGLAGALFKVIAIPALNLGVGFGLTYIGVRQIFRRSFGRKTIGWLAALALATWMVGFNLVIAHWRDSLESAISIDAGRAALDRMLSAPLSLNNLTSWILFAIGLGAALIAVFDALMFRDRHPGFARRQAQVMRWRNEYADVCDDAQAQLQEESEDALAELSDAMRRAEASASERSSIVQNTIHLCDDLHRYRDHLGSVANDLVNRYRQANRGARTEPAPLDFAESLVIDFGPTSLNPLTDGTTAETAGVLRVAYTKLAAARDAFAAEIVPLDPDQMPELTKGEGP